MNIDSFKDPNYNPGMRLRIKNKNIPRYLAEKASPTKIDLQKRLEIILENLKDEFNGGDLKGFQKAFPRDGFVKKI